MGKRKRASLPTVGGSSLLVMFAVLCLTVFALLGLSTVLADRRLSDASAEAVAGYYRADCEAEKILAQLRGGQLPGNVHVDDGLYSYSCVISETRQLRVALRRSGEEWEILCWRAESVAQWETDDSLTVWDGETIS